MTKYNFKKFFILCLISFLFIIINLNTIIFYTTSLGIKYYLSTGNNVKTEKLLKINLFFQTKTIFKNQDLIVLSINKLGEFYDEQGLYKELEHLYEKYFDLLLNFNSKNTSNYYNNSYENMAYFYSYIGDIKLKNDNYNESENFYLKAIDIKLKSGELYPTIWREFNKIGYLKIKNGDYIEAEKYLSKAIKNYKERPCYNDNKVLDSKIIYNLSLLEKNKGNYKKAESYAQYLLLHSPSTSDFRPIPNIKKNKYNFLIEISKCNIHYKENLATIYLKLNKEEDALQLLEESTLISNNLDNKVNLNKICNHYNLYKLYSENNNTHKKTKELNEIEYLKPQILLTKDIENKNLLKILDKICQKGDIK